MIIKSVEINNFFIIGHAHLELHNRGLVRICGDNNDDTTSGSNGSGKSSIVEAIYWALFGDTLRSLKGADGVVNNTVKKDCYVVVELEEGENVYRIERYRKHSKKKNNLYLYINGVDSRGKDNRETQVYIEDILSIDKLSFANSIVFGQGYSKNLRRFSELTDKEQKECLESILDIEVFSVAHAEAVKELKDIAGLYDIHDREREIILRGMEEDENELRMVEIDYENFDADKLRRIADIRLRQEEVVGEMEKLEEQLLSFPRPREEDEIIKASEEYKSDLEVYRSKKEKLKEKYDTAKNKILVIKNGISKEVGTLYLSLDKLKVGREDGSECAYCGASVSSTRILDRRGEIEFEIVDKERTISSLEKDLKEVLTAQYEKKIAQVVEVVSMIEEVLSNLIEERQNIFSLRMAREKIESKREYLGIRAETYVGEIERIGLEQNPHAGLVTKLEGSIQKKRARSEELTLMIGELQEKEKYYTFWKEGFSRGGIRSYLLDKVIPFLTERANKYLNILTDGGIRVQFNARKQLSSGEWRENFNVEVFNTHASDTYEGNSGGEKRRIDLAISLAINDFIASRSGKRLNILLLDEVFENIDETGVYFVVKVLEELAKNRSSVFVITHHDSLASYFNETITLSRKDGLSYIQ